MKMQSEQINELAAAMAKVQSKLTGAVKDSANPFFKSKYADLNSCWDACRKVLTDNGLAVIQTTDVNDFGPVLLTTLMHTSGQWIRGALPIKAKDDGPQAQGSGITYARRYALAAIVGLVQVDDDAEAAQGRGDDRQSSAARAAATRNTNQYAKAVMDAVDKDDVSNLKSLLREVRESGEDAAISLWASLPTPVKNYIQTHAKEAA
jgi:hypothetical protein